MSSEEEEFEKMIERLDAGEDKDIPGELKDTHAQLVKGVAFIEEQAMREKLTLAHDSLFGMKKSNSGMYWTIGIAASVVGIFLWWNSSNTSQTNFELQMDEAPAYADSATYDSLKIIEPEVDKTIE